ncbi:hypothetical protein KGQ20_14370 [Catenulispora sp. NF23]|uniref:Universal stress protein n=1 Tax=Catenulispora pinistramenti TaxID=2705254 RepID=A0ABS5KX19_9ACTN|nr:hypothetical protein [Catenulispora pinistramenti]MBS2533956.1 hypothetical protein [Catenulispora pinistramenti]MBS2550577.1 hypothetical protein [Catenulispora pinistramenti]
MPSTVLLVVPQESAGPSPGALARTTEAAGAGPVTVMTVLRVHGSALGVPHPGLLPTAAERERGLASVGAALAALRARRVQAHGEIVVTRAEARAISRTARAVGATTVVLDLPRTRGARRLVEGDLAARVRRRLREEVLVDSGPAGPFQ